MAAMYGMKKEDLAAYMGDSEKESMKRDIAVKKAVEFVMANAKERAKAKSKTAEADTE
jgi:trigger factor